MEYPFPTTQRNHRRSQPFSGYFVRWLGPVAGGKRCGNENLPFSTLS
ncbi:hypothetical protein [Melghirimyces algeriensis]|nr:hypothetical protein [Melghirimyces algeriensis]